MRRCSDLIEVSSPRSCRTLGSRPRFATIASSRADCVRDAHDRECQSARPPVETVFLPVQSVSPFLQITKDSSAECVRNNVSIRKSHLMFRPSFSCGSTAVGRALHIAIVRRTLFVWADILFRAIQYIGNFPSFRNVGPAPDLTGAGSSLFFLCLTPFAVRCRR